MTKTTFPLTSIHTRRATKSRMKFSIADERYNQDNNVHVVKHHRIRIRYRQAAKMLHCNQGPSCPTAQLSYAERSGHQEDGSLSISPPHRWQHKMFVGMPMQARVHQIISPSTLEHKFAELWCPLSLTKRPNVSGMLTTLSSHVRSLSLHEICQRGSNQEACRTNHAITSANCTNLPTKRVEVPLHIFVHRTDTRRPTQVTN